MSLQIERIFKLRSAGRVSDTIQDRLQASATIDYLYTGILENIKRTDSVAYETANRALSWVLCIQQLLSSDANL